MPAAVQANVSTKFRVDRTVTADVTLLEMSGVVDEGFESEKTAASIKSKKIVIDLGRVRRFASWGMSRWTEFARECGAKDMYIVEASTHAVNQFHLVTGLIGHAKLVSFYASYRCGKCGEESQTLIVVPSDREQLQDTEQSCPTCGGTSRMDTISKTLCASIAEQPPFDIDDEVISFLRSRYRYNITPDVQRFRAARTANDTYVYMRLTGNVHGVPAEALARNSEKTTVLDIGGLTIPARTGKGLTAWRAYIRAALPNVTALQLLDCPAGFLDQGVAIDDFPKLKVRTFVVDYVCHTCQVGASKLVDVAPNLEDLAEGRFPTEPCATCAQPMVADVSPEIANIIRRLPVLEHDTALDKFLARARSLPAQDYEDGLKEREVKQVKQTSGPTRALYIASILMVLVTAALVTFGLGLWKKSSAAQPVAPKDDVVGPKPINNIKRPDWILSDAPLTGYCNDQVNRVMCVGVSGYAKNQEDGLVDANDAALDELLFTIGLRSTDPFFRDAVLPTYSDARAKALASLQLADTDRTSKAYIEAATGVRAARKRAIELLKATGGAAVPAQRSDWYWEEYAVDKAPGKTETLVFVRYDIPLEQLKTLVETYSTAVPVIDGVTAVTAFPSLAWRYPAFGGGAMIATAAGKPATAGLAPAELVTKVGETTIKSAPELAKLAHDPAAGKSVMLGVSKGEEPVKQIKVDL